MNIRYYLLAIAFINVYGLFAMDNQQNLKFDEIVNLIKKIKYLLVEMYIMMEPNIIVKHFYDACNKSVQCELERPINFLNVVNVGKDIISVDGIPEAV